MTPTTGYRAADIAIVGLGVMGESLALNFQRHGFEVCGHDSDAARRASFAARTGRPAAASLREMVSALGRPRRILLMVPAGGAVDAVLAGLRPLLEADDVVIDGGNSHFAETQRRLRELGATGVLYVGAGVSGGEDGALHGPAIMPGGDARAWPVVAPLLQAVAARADDGQPCCDWVGPDGAGHFVKMVHNGIEYADMQTIGEAFWLLQEVLGMPPHEIAAVFAQWNEGELASYLVGITAAILARTDPETGEPLVNLILDTAEQKGTGRWTSQVALDLGVSAPTIAAAVFARTLSAARGERIAASALLAGPRPRADDSDRARLVEKIRDALLAAKVCAYAQGFQLLHAADHEYHWQLPMGTIAGLWRAGCIIRARLLEDIRAAYARQPDLANLLVDPALAQRMSTCQQDLRDVVALAAQRGVAVPALMSALAYYDGFRARRLPAGLLQAQRDYFGAHGYRRVDRLGTFHTRWTE